MMTTTHWLTVILALVGIISNVGWFLFTRFVKTQDELKHALTSDTGAIARIHQRIDKLGDTYQTQKETEMQFDHLRSFMDHWRSDSQRRHEENLERFDSIKESQKISEDIVRQDVRELRTHLDDIRKAKA
jgi:hypothetical protein